MTPLQINEMVSKYIHLPQGSGLSQIFREGIELLSYSDIESASCVSGLLALYGREDSIEFLDRKGFIKNWHRSDISDNEGFSHNLILAASNENFVYVQRYLDRHPLKDSDISRQLIVEMAKDGGLFSVDILDYFNPVDLALIAEPVIKACLDSDNHFMLSNFLYSADLSKTSVLDIGHDFDFHARYSHDRSMGCLSFLHLRGNLEGLEFDQPQILKGFQSVLDRPRDLRLLKRVASYFDSVGIDLSGGSDLFISFFGALKNEAQKELWSMAMVQQIGSKNRQYEKKSESHIIRLSGRNSVSSTQDMINALKDYSSMPVASSIGSKGAHIFCEMHQVSDGRKYYLSLYDNTGNDGESFFGARVSLINEDGLYDSFEIRDCDRLFMMLVELDGSGQELDVKEMYRESANSLLDNEYKSDLTQGYGSGLVSSI
ncbi:MAG: hypothetical protein IBX55_00290 [Methyloprofundus sp.]|nr:hypothetical protein [Methyloprofundus sp.]